MEILSLVLAMGILMPGSGDITSPEVQGHPHDDGYTVAYRSSPDTENLDLSADWKRDLEGMASDLGITFEESVKLYAWQPEFGQLLAEISREFPDQYVGAEATGHDNPAAWIAFTEAPVDWLENRVTSIPTAIEIRENSDYLTEIQINSEIRSIHEQILKLDYVDTAVTQYDLDTNSVIIEYAVTSEAGLLAKIVGSNQIMSTLADSEFDRFSISQNDAAGYQPQTIYGGRWIKKGGVNHCTTGFTVMKGSVKGVLTAGHCKASNLTYEGTTLFSESTLNSSFGDMMWLRTNESLTNRVYTTSTGTIAITSISAPFVGQSVRLYGMSSGAVTDTVHSQFVCAGGYCDFVLTQNNTTLNGDSGGPWRQGNSAVGVHGGNVTIGGVTRAAFTKVTHAGVHLQLSVKTS